MEIKVRVIAWVVLKRTVVSGPGIAREYVRKSSSESNEQNIRLGCRNRSVINKNPLQGYSHTDAFQNKHLRPATANAVSSLRQRKM